MEQEIIWQDYLPYFTRDELSCKHCGASGVDKTALDALLKLRIDMGVAFIVNSAYRCEKHPVEVNKPHGGGSHTTGKAFDIKLKDPSRYLELVAEAYKQGFHGVGINKNFVHLDMAESRDVAPRPAIFPY